MEHWLKRVRGISHACSIKSWILGLWLVIVLVNLHAMHVKFFSRLFLLQIKLKIRTIATNFKSCMHAIETPPKHPDKQNRTKNQLHPVIQYYNTI